MTLSFRCNSLVSFDPVQQRYVTCEHKIQVKANQVGDSVECPECGNTVEVPLELRSTVGSAPTASPDQSQRTNPSATRSAGTPSATAAPKAANAKVGTSRKSPSDQAPLRTSTPTKQKQPDAAAFESAAAAPAKTRATSSSQNQHAPPTGVPTAGTAAIAGASASPDVAADSSRHLEYANFDPSHACIHCGAQVGINMQTCPTCGAARRVLTDEKPLHEYEFQPTGLHLWFQRQLLTPTTSKGFFAGVISFILLWVSVGICFSAFVILQTFSIIVIAPVLALTLAYFLAMHRLRRMAAKPGLPMYGWQRVLWNCTLPVFRRIKWRFSAFPNATLLDLRGQNFMGKDLHEMPGFRSHNIVDLHGSFLSDRELRTMHELKNLHALILTKTQVGHEAVYRLQQALPRTWIWY